MKRHAGIRSTPLMVKKFYSMLFSGTLTMMVVVTLLMSDSLVAGTVIGEDAAAGITLVTPLFSLAAFFSSIFSIGIPVLYGATIGKFDKKEADRTFGFGMTMALIVGLILFALATIFGNLYLQSYNAPDPVFKNAQGYLFWMRFTVLLFPLYMLISEMVLTDGDETVSLISVLVQGFGNVGASIVLSRFMGTEGIGLASFLFTFISIAILFLHFFKKTNTLKINLYFSWKLFLNVVRYSIIDAGSYLFLSVFTAFLNFFVSRRFGPEYLIVVTAIALIREFQLIFDGIGETITPIMGVYLGEDCVPGVKRIYSLTVRVAIVEGILVTAALFIFAPFVPGILGISDPEVANAAVNSVRIVGVGSTFVSLLYLSTSYYLLIDRISLGLAVSALRDVFASVPLVLMLGLPFGHYGVFIALMLAPALSWGGTMLYLKLRYKDDAPLLLNKRNQGEKALLYDLTVEPDSIVRVRDAVGEDLTACGYDKRTVNRVMLLFEELFMLLYEKNEGKTILGECGLLLTDDRIRLIARDTGVKFDLTDPDMAVFSLRSYVVSNVAQQISLQKRHLSAMSFNRNVFEIKGNKTD